MPALRPSLSIAGMLLLGTSLAGCATDGAKMKVGAGLNFGSSTEMHDGGVVMPPAGWRDFCVRTPSDPACQAAELTPERAKQIEQAQAMIRGIPAKSDEQLVGKAEFWRVADSRGGDCEDVALAARAKLLQQGFPRSALRLATAFTERGEYHLVLTVDVSYQGRVGTLVIDRRMPRVMSWNALSKVGYRFDTRQAAKGLAWVQIDNARPGLKPLQVAAVRDRAIATAAAPVKPVEVAAVELVDVVKSVQSAAQMVGFGAATAPQSLGPVNVSFKPVAPLSASLKSFGDIA